MKKLFVFIIIFVLLSMVYCLAVVFLIPSKAVAAPAIDISQLTSGALAQYPSINGDKIVWQDYRGYTNAYVYLYDLTNHTETPLITSSTMIFSPRIYGDKIAWEQEKEGAFAFNIFMYDLTNHQQTTITDVEEGSEEYNPFIFAEKIVWGENSDAFRILMHDLATHQTTTVAPYASIQLNPYFYDTKIVWQDNRNGNYDIYMYDLETAATSRITSDPADQTFPRIFGNKIIWADARNAGDSCRVQGKNCDLYSYDLISKTEQRITFSPTVFNNYYGYAIYRNKVAWTDKNGSDYGVYLYNFIDSSTTKIYDQTVNSLDIYENMVVWAKGELWGEVGLATLTYPDTLAFNNLPDSSDQINLTNGQIVTGTVNLQVKPYSENGVQDVKFYVDDNLICTEAEADQNGVYSCDWDTSEYHSDVKVTASDYDGHPLSLERTVIVQQEMPLPQELPETGANWAGEGSIYKIVLPFSNW